ncbi:hypothetical protein VP424E501_P0126 [Vibrio phage 424E50-1]|nr:hypothetical protein VP424E501_P0126 [Vibrio phage 424E50-1]
MCDLCHSILYCLHFYTVWYFVNLYSMAYYK